MAARRLVLVASFIIAALLRLSSLDQVYWHDEAFTSLRLAGHDVLSAHEALFDGNPTSVAELLRAQWPRAEHGLADTIRSLARDDPQHPPLYYVLAWLWVRCFGSTIEVLRSLSVVLGLIALPAIDWLCRELFTHESEERAVVALDGRRVGTLAFMLLAVSPVHVLYAQEAREYALWTTLTILSCASLLRAWRRRTWRSWVLYGVVTLLGLYTSPLTGLVVIGHAVHLLWRSRMRLTGGLLRFGATIAAVGLLFSPWMWLIVHQTTGLSWTEIPIPGELLAKMWGLHVARAFIVPPGDFGFDATSVSWTLGLAAVLGLHALHTVARTTPPQVRSFLLIMFCASWLPLALPDLVVGGQRSTATRYLLPSILAAQTALAISLAHGTSASARWRRAWIVSTASILATSLVSSLWLPDREATWIKVVNYNLPSVARIIDAHPRPTVICSSEGINFGSVLALGHRLTPEARLLLVDGRRAPPRAPRLPSSPGDVFVLNPSEAFIASLEEQSGTNAHLVFEDFHLALWQL